MFAPSRGHCLAEPIEVRGAEPGQALAVHIDWIALDAFHLSEAIRSVTA
jgi:acetamidase/formamidase